MGKFTGLLASGIKKRVDAGEKKAEVVADMASKAGITSGTMNAIITGEIENPAAKDPKRVRGIAKALGTAEKTLLSALKEDGHEITAKFAEEAMADTFAEVKGVKIWEAGTPQSGDFTEEDIPKIIHNFSALQENPASLHVPPVVLTHGEEQGMLKADGLPAAGWHQRLWQQGKAIYADVTDVPKLVAKALEKKAFRKCSAEIYQDYVDAEGKHHGPTLRRVALLGGDIPRIRGLSDWLALDEEPATAFSEGHPEYTTEVIQYDETMSDELAKEDRMSRFHRIFWKTERRMNEIISSSFLTEKEKKAKLQELTGEMQNLMGGASKELVESFSELTGGDPMSEPTGKAGEGRQTPKMYSEEEVQEKIKAATDPLRQTTEQIQAERRREKVDAFCEKLKAKGLVPAIADDPQLHAFMESMDDQAVESYAEGEGDKKTNRSQRVWFESFLEGLVDKDRKGGLTVPFGEVTGDPTPHGSAPGMDEEEVMHQAALKYAEDNKVSYREAVNAVAAG